MTLWSSQAGENKKTNLCERSARSLGSFLIRRCLEIQALFSAPVVKDTFLFSVCFCNFFVFLFFFVSLEGFLVS